MLEINTKTIFLQLLLTLRLYLQCKSVIPSVIGDLIPTIGGDLSGDHVQDVSPLIHHDDHRGALSLTGFASRRGLREPSYSCCDHCPENGHGRRSVLATELPFIKWCGILG